MLLRRFIETCTNEPQDVCAFFLEIVFYFHKTFFAHVSNRQDASTGAMQSQDFSYKKAMKPSCREEARLYDGFMAECCSVTVVRERPISVS